MDKCWCNARRQRERESGATDVATGPISTASKAKKSEKTLADTRLEMEVISHGGSITYEHGEDEVEVEGTARRGRVQSYYGAGVSPHG